MKDLQRRESSEGAPAAPGEPVATALVLPGIELPATPKASLVPRNPLFDALAQAEGSDPRELTNAGAKAIGVALAAIKRVSPDVTPEEITRRMDIYRQLMPNITHTATGLAKHWAKCASAPSPTGEILFPWTSHEQVPEWFWRSRRYEFRVSMDYLQRAFHDVRGDILNWRKKYALNQWAAVLGDALKKYHASRETRPSGDDDESNAYGFTGELDPHGDLAWLRSQGFAVKSHEERWAGKRLAEEWRAKAAEDSARKDARPAPITAWKEVPNGIRDLWPQFTGYTGLAENERGPERESVQRAIVDALNRGVESSEIARAMSAHSLARLNAVLAPAE